MHQYSNIYSRQLQRRMSHLSSFASRRYQTLSISLAFLRLLAYVECGVRERAFTRPLSLLHQRNRQVDFKAPVGFLYGEAKPQLLPKHQHLGSPL
jgi:hypothetical protein